MNNPQDVDRRKALAQTAEIVAAHLSNNALSLEELPTFIDVVFGKLVGLAAGGEASPIELVPAVPIRRSVTDDHIVCLEDGKKLKILKRHLMSDHAMTPAEYRAKWGLRPDYPMVASAYAEMRKAMAIKIGLGRKPVLQPPAPKPKRPRSKPPAA